MTCAKWPEIYYVPQEAGMGSNTIGVPNFWMGLRFICYLY